MTGREEFIKKIHATFKVEASEALLKIGSSLIELEKESDESLKTIIVETVFREAHSLKGAARAVNFSEFEMICQSVESIFSSIKTQKIALYPSLFDLLHKTVNIQNELLAGFGEATDYNLSMDLSDLILNLVKAESENIGSVETTGNKTGSEKVDVLPEPKSSVNTENSENKSLNDFRTTPVMPGNTVRVSVDKLDNLLAQIEEIITIKQTFGHINQSARSVISKFDSLFSEMADSSGLNLSALRNIRNELVDLHKFALQETFNTGIRTDILLNTVREVISIPFSSILAVFPKAARDISKANGKLVDLIIKGEEIEIDKRILEELSDPLMHLLRNSIDHGIEKPERRKNSNKPETGTIRLTITRTENSTAEIIFSDDGAGVDLNVLRAKYIKKEKITAEEAEKIPDPTLLEYMFKSGVSTSDMITDLSGRGLGLAIVKEKVEETGGNISVKTSRDIGTEFIISIPLSLVTLRCIRIKVGDQEFFVPTSRTEKVITVKRIDIKTIENKPTIEYKGSFIPMVHIADVLGIQHKTADSDSVVVLIAGSDIKLAGFVIDGLINEEEVVVKKFNRQLKKVKNFSGASTLSTGKVILILNISDLITSSEKRKVFLKPEITSTVERVKKSILVVEDSITSRMLLKNILESSGYNVTTAIDGIDGLTKLKGGNFNLVVSDVDMPRLNGFDMTLRIRNDKAVSDVPVVLVTSLSKREDQEHGIEVGANAYIIKGSFDQSNLLEAIERLI